jgi:rSAM/selenodomain-associated transferase 1
MKPDTIKQGMETAYPLLKLSSPAKTPTTARKVSCALAIMTKAPLAGTVKTRLVPPLTHEAAAALSVCFLRDTAINIAGVASFEAAECIAVYMPVGAESTYDNLLQPGFSLLAQRGESFGERLYHAAEDLLALGYQSLCLIDSDSPTLPRSLLADAVRSLAQAGDRVVLGPSDDGGYYLIGLKHAHRRLFEDINWSTDKVLDQTVERAAEIGLERLLLPSWYDVDDGASLNRLCDELFLPGIRDNARNHLDGYEAVHTRQYLTRLMNVEGRERIWPAEETLTEAAS